MIAKIMRHHLFLLVLLSARPINCSFKLGVENIPASLLQTLKKHKVGLIVNQTSMNQTGKSTASILQDAGIKVAALLVPEHGLHGTVAASADVAHGMDTATKLPIVSLYEKGSGKKIDVAMLNALDVLIFDIQDSGMRHYTYISTLYRILEAAGIHNKPLIVLDRPNPLGCRMEGPLVESDLISFISIASIPVRHGMTVGELAVYFNQHIFEKKASLHIVPMANYIRTMEMPSTVSCHLSPNIKTKASCYGYSFLGLLGEIRPFNVCVGTDKAFQALLLPDDLKVHARAWHELSTKLHALGIQTLPYAYTHDRKKKKFTGLQLVIDDINGAQSWNALVTVLHFFKTKGIELQCSKEFDKAIGTRLMRSFIEKDQPLAIVHAQVRNNLEQFLEKARSVFMYMPAPMTSEIK